MKKYDFKKIEKKWQKRWAKKKVFVAADKSKKPKYYSLVEFPYPSGAGLHVGHIRSYTALDIISRKRRMEGHTVLYPVGWDAFGLPTENYAIKTGISPQIATKKNTDTFRRQLKSLGFSFDWSREINTTDPNYYRWTQWLFLQFFKHGLAYKAKAEINWCPNCKIGLANEEVVGGKCERCGTPVEKRQKKQWMLKITAYADKLLAGLKGVDFLPEIKTQQENWIGRSSGAEITFPLAASSRMHTDLSTDEHGIKVFTTRPDTLFGATYLVLAPEHPLLTNNELRITNNDEIKKYVAAAKKKTEIERGEGKEKTGVELKGIQALHPATKEEMPIWVADYVLGNYGTGAIMAVPQHDERDRAFAEKYKLPTVDKPLVSWDEALKISSGKKTVTYKLRDWVFSRQRYWGEPIPLLFCEQCRKRVMERSKVKRQSEKVSEGEIINPGWFPIPEKELPVELPKVKKYQPTDTGESPLSKIEKWVNTKCPRCKGSARRETDTMPNWAGSSWYYLAYLMSKKAFAGPASIENWKLQIENFRRWLPVDWYNGGMEHVTLHLLYSRFWNLFLHDIGLVPVKEPYKKRTAQGTILAADGKKMSKSLGNVVNPDELIKKFGADALRLYEMFIGPFDQTVSWDPRGILGTARFLEKVWKIGLSFNGRHSGRSEESIIRLLHKTIKKVSEDSEAMNFNTAVSAMMIFVNALGVDTDKHESENTPRINTDDWQKFLRILSPFAPHIVEELNSKLKTRKATLLCDEEWPSYDPKLIEEAFAAFAVQVNGRTRAIVQVPREATAAQAQALALANPAVKKWINAPPTRVIYVAGRLINFVLS